MLNIEERKHGRTGRDNVFVGNRWRFDGLDARNDPCAPRNAENLEREVQAMIDPSLLTLVVTIVLGTIFFLLIADK